MTTTLTLAFLGRARVAHFTAPTLSQAMGRLMLATVQCEPAYRDWLTDALAHLSSYERSSAEWRGWAITRSPAPPDEFAWNLERITHSFPPHPGLDYDLADQCPHLRSVG